MNWPKFKTGDMVTWEQKSSLVPGPEPIFLVTKVDQQNKIVYVLVPNEGINSTYSSYLRKL
jgi:hypothetical protein